MSFHVTPSLHPTEAKALIAHTIEPSVTRHFSNNAQQSKRRKEAQAAREGCVAKQTKFDGCFL
jgi:hypothetical protein